MIEVFVEAALRSLLAGLAVALGLRIFRVRNVLAQKAAWGLVLVSALAMPLLLPITARWHLLPAGVNLILPAHPMTLLEELQAHIQAKGGASTKLPSQAAPIYHGNPPNVHEPPAPEQSAAPRAGEGSSRTAPASGASKQEQHALRNSGGAMHVSTPPVGRSTSAIPDRQSTAPVRRMSVSPRMLLFTLYSGIAAFFLVRLAVGLFTTIRLWRTATPISVEQLPYGAPSVRVRVTNRVASPLTIGSAVLLPADCATWDRRKLRIVLAHESSHIRQGDFYLQLLAAFYSALVWFSPLGWWLKHKLAELAEAISDRAAMEEAASCTTYAQILLEFAAMPRRVTIGVAMARPGSLSRRIERLLNDDSFRQCFAGGRRALIAVVLVPLALLASTTLIRVQAATAAHVLTPAQSSAPTTLGTPGLSIAPKLDILQAAPTEKAMQIEEPTSPQLSPDTSALLTFVSQEVVPAAEPAPQMIAAVSPAPIIRSAPVIAILAAGKQESGSLSFDRTLSVSGAAQLAVSTGSGNIHISRGSGNQVHIHGKIHVNDNGSEEEARQIAANPPIEQQGDAIRIGQHEEHWRGISIDYQIEAPAGTLLTANSGSGNIDDDGVGRNAKLETGSGDIHATGLQGGFAVKTGSGNIVAAQTGEGDVVAETGSGEIELKDIHGSFRGQTGSGNIKASGTPASTWILQTGSGDIELWTGNAPMTIDASTGSGSVNTQHEMLVQGSFDHHHVQGKLNGGGPTVRVQTGSGDIRIH